MATKLAPEDIAGLDPQQIQIFAPSARPAGWQWRRTWRRISTRCNDRWHQVLQIRQVLDGVFES